MLIFTIKAVPASGKNKWVVDKSGILKCYLKNPAEKGKANAELIKLLAIALEIPQTSIELIAGETARTKKIKIHQEMTYQQVLKKLGIETGKQHAIF